MKDLATYVYLHTLGAPHKAFLQNLRENPPAHDLFLVAHEGPVLEALHYAPFTGPLVVPAYDPLFPLLPNRRPSDTRARKVADAVGIWTFVEMLRHAKRCGYANLLVIEWDCRFSATHWDDRILAEFAAHPDAPTGGSPVCWHPWTLGHRWSRRMIEFAHEYQRRAGVPMAFEGGHSGEWGPVFYPNGALAIYRVAEVFDYFLLGDCLPYATSGEQVSYATRRVAWDHWVGRELYRRYGAECITRVAGLACVYSGCGEHHVPEADRVHWLRTGAKVAVHQIKDWLVRDASE